MFANETIDIQKYDFNIHEVSCDNIEEVIQEKEECSEENRECIQKQEETNQEDRDKNRHECESSQEAFLD